MGGKPASRQGDATAKGGPIVQGSASVLIGAASGIACSVCPGGMAVGNPVNPALGAKVLAGETDVALPGPLPFVLSRHYSSYQTATPGPVGMFGPGWQTAAEVSLLTGPGELILNDNGGRSLHFSPLDEGEIVYSASEGLWLARGGAEQLPAGHALSGLWQALPQELRGNPHFYFVASDALGPWWMLGYGTPYVPEETAVLPAPLPPRRCLQGIADRFGRTLRYERAVTGESAGAITRVTDGAGRDYRLSYIRCPLPASSGSGWGSDSGLRLSAVWLRHDPEYGEGPETPLVRYDYSERGELVSVYDRAGVQTRHFSWQPDLPGRMASHQYAGRPASHYRWDAQGRVSHQTNPEGLSYQFIYQPDRTQVTDDTGRTQVYHFAGEGGLRRLIKQVQADGSTLSWTFDGSGRLRSQTDALGRLTEFELDVATGRLLGVTGPDGSVTRYGYNRQGQLIHTITPDGSRTEQQYDGLGRLTAITDPQGAATRHHYTADNSELPAMTADPAGGIRTMAWTAYGQPARYTDCSGKETGYRYDRWGQLTRLEQEEGQVSLYHYDAQGRLIRKENGAAEATEYGYNGAGDLTVIRHPDGSESRTAYSSRGQPVQRSNGGLVQQFHYDRAGRLQRLVNENGVETRFSWDEMDRLTAESSFDGMEKRYAYNPGGELIRSEEAGQVTHWYYDTGGRLIKRERVPLADGSPDEEHWCWHKNGQLQSVWHHSEGHRVSVEYWQDKAGRKVKEQQRVQTAGGELCWQHTTEQRYQLTGVPEQTLADGLPPLHWQTYGAGHLLGVSLDGQSLLEFDRDSLHRERERRFAGSIQQTQYNPAGRLQQQVLSGRHGTQLNREYHYDRRGQLTQIDAGTETLSYHYDAAGRLSEAQTAFYHHQYHYDPAGNRLSALPPRPVVAYPDDLPVDTRYDRGNRLTEDEHWHYRYDSRGNLIQKNHKRNAGEVHDYVWDGGNRLVQYRHTSGWSEGRHVRQGRYLYDPLGRRVGKQTRHTRAHGQDDEDSTQTHWYGWDGDNLVLTERDGQRIHTVYPPGSFVPLLRIEAPVLPPVTPLADRLEQASGLRFPDELKARFHQTEQALRQGELSEAQRQWLADIAFTPERLLGLLDPLPERELQVHLYHCNHLGTPLALLNQQGEADWQAELDGWGSVVSEHNPQRLYQPVRMQGQQYDEESGLHYNRHRYYDPGTGRYISQDPIGIAGGMNVYGYVSNNPLQSIDPLGLSRADDWGAIGGTGGAIAGGTIVAAGSVVVDAGTFGVNILATPAEIAGGVAVGGAIGWLGGYVLGGVTDGLESGVDWIIYQMSKGGRQSKENEYSRESRKQPDPCEWLKAMYDAATCSSEKMKIKTAQKAMNCRKNSTQK